MNIDLGELMRERSAVAETTVRTDRVTEVRRRIGRARRRRAAGAAAATVAVVVTTTVAATLLPDNPAPDPAPVATMRTIDGFPEYQAGARVIGTGVAELPATELSVTVVSNLDLVFATRCDTRMWLEVRVAGRAEFIGTSCGPDGGTTWRPGPELLATYGAVPGEPVTYTATVTDGTRAGEVILPVPERGTFALAVMQRVPFEEYPFPPRPATLASIDYDNATDGELLMRSDPLEPQQPVSRTLAWSSSQILHVASNSPGFVHLSLGGTRILTLENWDYGVAQAYAWLGDEGLPQFAEGTLVTVTVEAEHVTGAWAVWTSPSPPVGNP